MYLRIIQISNICAPPRKCSGAHVIFTGLHMLEIWTIGTCATCITFEANVYFCSVNLIPNGCISSNTYVQHFSQL